MIFTKLLNMTITIAVFGNFDISIPNTALFFRKNEGKCVWIKKIYFSGQSPC